MGKRGHDLRVNGICDDVRSSVKHMLWYGIRRRREGVRDRRVPRHPPLVDAEKVYGGNTRQTNIPYKAASYVRYLTVIMKLIHLPEQIIHVICRSSRDNCDHIFSCYYSYVMIMWYYLQVLDRFLNK